MGIQLTNNLSQCIRKDAGSPAVSYVFSNKQSSFKIENLGDDSIYFNFDSAPNAANSGTILLGSGTGIRDFPVQACSVNIAAASGLTPTVQVIGFS